MPIVYATNPFERAHALGVTRLLGTPVPARTRLLWARRACGLAVDWPDLLFDRFGGAHIVRDGFTVDVSYRADVDGSDSSDDLGEFTDRWAPGAVKNPEAWNDTGVPDSRVYAWFVPAVTAEDVRVFLRDQGVGRHEAWLQGQRDVRATMERCRGNGPDPQLVEVTVSLAGVQLARASSDGFTLDDDLPWADVHDQMVEVAVELIGDTIAEARAALAALTAAAAELRPVNTGSETFAQRQVRDVLDAGPDDGGVYRLKVSGAVTGKWVNITDDQLAAIYRVLGDTNA